MNMLGTTRLPRLAIAATWLLAAACNNAANEPSPSADAGLGRETPGARDIDADIPARPDRDATDVSDAVDVAPAAIEAASRGALPTALANARAAADVLISGAALDKAKTAAQNADAVASALATQLAASTCASKTATHVAGSVTIAIDFGSGCTFASGQLTVAGAISATASVDAAAVKVAFTFTGLTVNAMSLSGSLSASTTSGTASYVLSAALTYAGAKTVSFDGTIAPDGAGQRGFTIDGTGKTSTAGVESFDLKAVHHKVGTCYADAGALSLTTTAKTKGGRSTSVVEVVTFDAQTPTTGKVTVQIATAPAVAATLPAYGSCPGTPGGAITDGGLDAAMQRD